MLVIDEAHKLSLEVLEEIRLLGNFESAADKYLQILLLGQSELDDLLNRQDLRQFKQRIGLRLYIDRRTAAEIQQYIRFRWVKGGAREAPPFTADAITGIVQWSQGIPRLINSICDTALLMAYADESPLVGLNYIRAAATNLALEAGATPIGTSPHPTPHPVAHPVSSPVDRHHSSQKLGSLEMPEPSSVLTSLPDDPPSFRGLANYDDPKSNSSLLKRLAERFGLTH